MTTTPRTHYYTIRIKPTPAQEKQLNHLSWVASVTYDLAIEQAQCAARGEDISLVGLEDPAWEQPDRTASGEASALCRVGTAHGAPQGLLEYALTAGRDTHARGGPLPKPGTVRAPVAGAALIRPVTRTGVAISGVDGVVQADVGALPHWAATVWLTAVGEVAPEPQVDVQGAYCTGFSYIEPDTADGRWLMDVAVRWDRYAESALVPRWEDSPLSAERQAVAHLMGWA